MKKTLLILSSIFFALLIITFFVLQKPGEISSESASSGLVFEIDSISVDKMEIKSPSSSIIIEKQGTDWFVVQPIKYRADQNNVNQVIHYIKNMENKGTISSNPDKHYVFKVDKNGIQVTIFQKGTTSAGFVLGKMAGRYNEYYARKINSDEVILVGGVYSYLLDKPLKDWRDKEIFSCPKEMIREVSYKYENRFFTLKLQDSVWYVDKEKANQNIVDNIIQSLSALQADDFMDSVVTPKITATIDVSGTQIRFAYNKSLNNYFVQTSKVNQWYVLNDWRAKQVLKNKEEIIKKETPL